MTTTAVIEVLLGVLLLHVIIEAEAQVVIYRPVYPTVRHKSSHFGHTKNSQDIEHKPRMIPRYVYHKPFTVKFSDKCEG
jgi:hypothetical protein